MSDIKEEKIRERAYHLWEADGRADANHRDHWEQAHREVMAEGEKAGEASASESDKAALPGVSSTKPAEPASSDKPRKGKPAMAKSEGGSAALPGVSATVGAEKGTSDPASKKRGKSV